MRLHQLGCELAIMVGGSTAGMHRLLAGQAVACGLHLVDAATGEYDAAGLVRSLPGLDFVPLLWERFDLVVRRMEYFETPLQRLFAFTRTDLFRERAKVLGGYAW
jgi:molybdate-binding protein